MCCAPALTLIVAFAVLGKQGSLPGPDDVDSRGRHADRAVPAGAGRDACCSAWPRCSATTRRRRSCPTSSTPDQLEKANGRLWSIEAIANTFLGPPLGSLLLLGAFALPFFVDAGSFFVAAALVALIPGVFRAERAADAPAQSFKTELSEGVRWLMGHPLLRPMAIILGLMNAASAASLATFVLFSQEVLEIGPFLFSVLTFGRCDRSLDRWQHRLGRVQALRQRDLSGGGARCPGGGLGA